MIRIDKPDCPTVLQTRGSVATQRLCADYLSGPDDFNSGLRTFGEFDKSIYAAEEVKQALREAQHGKCAFCESFVPHISYGDVEHFRPKAGYKQRETDDLKRPGYYWLAYEWSNLFSACQLCNERFKGNLFPLKDGRRRARMHTHRLDKEEPLLVDPSRLDPADFIEFQDERAEASGARAEGEATIDILGLNRPELLEARGKRLRILRLLLNSYRLLRAKAADNPTPELLRLLGELADQLRQSREPAGEYAALAQAFLDAAATAGD